MNINDLAADETSSQYGRQGNRIGRRILDMLVIPRYDQRMAVEKFTVSFDSELAKDVRAQARENLSSWLADAARRKLRHRAAVDVLTEYEQQHGEISEDELEAVRKKWPG